MTSEKRLCEEGLPEDLFNSYMQHEELIPSLAGKTVAITGTTSGLGFHLARCAILKNAALVLLLNRKSERSEKSEKDLQKYFEEDAKTVVKSIDCDLNR
jgi:short-subunit dehydrogenase